MQDVENENGASLSPMLRPDLKADWARMPVHQVEQA
jgi:hypothetical protein